MTQGRNNRHPVAWGHQKYERSHLLGTWHLTVFPKKIGTKLFIFHTKKNYRFILLYLVLALDSRVHFRGKKLIFGKKKIRPKTP
jgi:hypothetical protein